MYMLEINLFIWDEKIVKTQSINQKYSFPLKM